VDFLPGGQGSDETLTQDKPWGKKGVEKLVLGLGEERKVVDDGWFAIVQTVAQPDGILGVVLGQKFDQQGQIYSSGRQTEKEPFHRW